MCCAFENSRQLSAGMKWVWTIVDEDLCYQNIMFIFMLFRKHKISCSWVRIKAWYAYELGEREEKIIQNLGSTLFFYCYVFCVHDLSRPSEPPGNWLFYFTDKPTEAPENFLTHHHYTGRNNHNLGTVHFVSSWASISYLLWYFYPNNPLTWAWP